MADEPIVGGDGAAEGPPPSVSLIITMHEGRVSLTGPLDDLVLCYGMVEVAKDQLRLRRAQQRAAIVPPSGFRLPLIGKRK